MTDHFVVMGMHRSGTSMMNGLMSKMGCYVGTPEELGDIENIVNPKGYFERLDVHDLCEAVINTMGLQWFQAHHIKKDTMPKPILKGSNFKFNKIVNTLNDISDCWSIKNPRLSSLMPLWIDLLDDPIFIHVFRNPLEVAKSIHKRNNFPIDFCLNLWEVNVLDCLHNTIGKRNFKIMHRDLIFKPYETVGALYENLKPHITSKNFHAPSKEDIEDFVEVSLYRNRDDKNEMAEHLSPSQRTLWDFIENFEFTEELELPPYPEHLKNFAIAPK